MSRPRVWLQAARPLAFANVAPPLLLGQALALLVHGRWSWPIFACGMAFAALDQLFIVFTNDVADAETDRANTTFGPFSGGSRVLPDGLLSPRELLAAGFAAAGLMLVPTLILAFAFARPWAVLVCVLAWFAAWAYSYPPLRLSYRGHGELVQGLGVGVLLPVFGFYAQAGTVIGLPWFGLVATFTLGVVSNVLTALPDVASDRASSKRTYPVRHGEATAMRHALELTSAAALAGAWVVPGTPFLVTWMHAALVLGALGQAVFVLRDRVMSEHDRVHAFVLLCAAAQMALWVGWTALALGSALLR
jgi:1,4-dihydroxy-2-naphthoate octaprenyltransferase